MAEGAEFTDGRIALRWITAPQSSIWYDSLAQMLAVFDGCAVEWCS